MEDALKKLKINQPASFEKMAKGMFQDNIIFLQWLYNYANKNGADNLKYYAAYNKRVRILERQGRSANEMNLHLLPARNRVEEEEWEAGCEAEEEVEANPNVQAEVQERIEGIDNFLAGL